MSENTSRRVVRFALAVACILPVLGISGCNNSENFVSSQTTETFVQDYNPHFLEVLWVIDDRSPMRNYRTRLMAEAATLFRNIDAQLGEFGQYRMAVTNMDGRVGKKGMLMPLSSPVILTRDLGTLDQRVAYFSNLFFPLLNLYTDAVNQGLGTSLEALKTTFKTDSRIPLVLIYLSYSDDHSEVASGDPVNVIADEILALKNNKQELVRVYAANYLPAVAPTPEQRCALADNNEIDGPGYQDRFFRLANRLHGQTTDLCAAGFANSFDLSGLQLKTLPKRFALQGFPKVETIKVAITRDGQAFNGYNWHFEPATREIVFDVTPPQGTTIAVTFLSAGN